HPALHSFPTRRSSDLMRDAPVIADDGDVLSLALPARDILGLLREGNEQKHEWSHGTVMVMVASFKPSAAAVTRIAPRPAGRRIRSEEHTSELQSRSDL